MRKRSEVFGAVILFLDRILLLCYPSQSARRASHDWLRHPPRTLPARVVLTSASVVPIILTSSALSSYFCSLPFGAGCHRPLMATVDPVLSLFAPSLLATPQLLRETSFRLALRPATAGAGPAASAWLSHRQARQRRTVSDS